MHEGLLAPVPLGALPRDQAGGRWHPGAALVAKAAGNSIFLYSACFTAALEPRSSQSVEFVTVPSAGTFCLQLCWLLECHATSGPRGAHPLSGWAHAGPKWVGPSSAQVGPKVGPSQKFGPPPKKLKIKIRSAQNVGKVWINGKKSSWPHLGPSGPIFCVGWKNRKNLIFLPIFLGGPRGPIQPLWANGCYPS